MDYKKNNTGIENTGNRNTGNLNTGDRNTGDQNTGDLNTGDQNTGNRNTGNRNTGYRNTGDRNTGNRNTGNRNTGNLNTGDRNTGDQNTGNRNTGYRNTGYLNTISPTKGLLFNKECELWDNNGDIILYIPNYFYFDVETTEWISYGNMTDIEKENNDFCAGGYLKVFETDKTLHMNWKKSFNNADLEDVKKTLDLPNFDYSIFEEITGITKQDFNIKLGLVTENIVGKEVTVTINGVVEVYPPLQPTTVVGKIKHFISKYIRGIE